MKLETFCTLPRDRENFWQVVLLPTIAILRSADGNSPYTAITGEWLFWSCSVLIK
jgi:hypothetical protein